MKSIVLTILLFTGLCVSAQDISGKITSDGNALGYVNVILISLPDSSTVDVVSSDDDGLFLFENVKNGEYYLMATLLGYTDSNTEKFSFQGNPYTRNIELKEDVQILSTVEIKARKPLLEQRADKLVVNVADNVTSLNGSLLDVMKKVPGMIVTNDKLSMAGQANPTILINGKTTRYMDVTALLRDIPGDNIQKVEVIHQPGSEYEASGSGPIINIILKKNSLFGTHGSATLGLGWDYDYEYNVGVRANHHAGPLSLEGNISINQNAWYEQLDLVRKIPVREQGEVVGNDVYTQLSATPGYPLTYRVGGGIDYDLTSRHRVGVSGRYSISSNDRSTSNATDIKFNDGTEVNVKGVNLNDRNWNFISINPYYTFEIDTSGQKLDIDYNWFTFKRDNVNTLQNTSNSDALKIRNTRNNQKGDVDVQAVKLDYVLPISKNFILKFGSKYSKAALDNDLQVFSDPTSTKVWEKDERFSNRYIFDESIFAYYGKTEWSYGAWNGTLGLRHESSDSKGYNVTIDSSLTRNIGKLFPSASISRSIVGPVGFNIAYSQRIERPRYSSLNPFVYYLDPFTSDRGNQKLRPEFTDSYKASITYESQPFFTVEYKDTRDAMVEVTQQDDETGETSKLVVNLEKYTNTNVTLGVPLDVFLPVSGFAAVIVNNNRYDSPYLDGNFYANNWSVTGYLQASVNLPWDINTEISGWYNSGELEGLIRSDWMYGVSLGMSKKFLDDKLKISLGIDDLFNRFAMGDIKYQNMDIDFISSWQNRSVSMRATYNFGKKYFKDSKRKGGASSELNRASGK